MGKPAELEGGRQARKPSSLRMLRTVFWSFFGVRRRSDNQDDFSAVTPVQIIVAGVIGAVIFVATLIMLVRFIVN
jgi:Protein of unknown function (DUF2970)